MFMQIFVYSIIQYPVSSFAQTLDLSQLYDFSFFFLLQNACDKNSQCQNNAIQLASLDSRSRDIDACAPLHSCLK